MYRWLTIACALLVSCSQPSLGPASAPSAVVPAPTVSRALSVSPSEVAPRRAPAPEPEPLPVCQARGRAPLLAARGFYEGGEYLAALACAAQAGAQNPDDPDAHSERGAALAALGRLDEASLAYARALALDPDHLDALLGAGHLYGVSYTSTRERDELAALYSERGFVLAQRKRNRPLLGEFALLSAMIFNDLGQADDALLRAEQAKKLLPRNSDASYERAAALFELCRFREAKAAFTALIGDEVHGAQAHYQLALLLEREGKGKQADVHFAQARSRAPEEFPIPTEISPEAFKEEVKAAIAALPSDMRRDLEGVPVTAEELPDDQDLLADSPPLSPTILGLFRGPPLSEACPPHPGRPCRSVALYRKNLARAVTNRTQLNEQVRITLLHEVGHLRGEDDYELAARGLE